MGRRSGRRLLDRLGAQGQGIRPALDHALVALLVAAGYYLGGRLGLALRFSSSLTAPVWPPNAVLMTALLLSPARRWWLWLLAAVPAHLALYLPLEIPLWRQGLQVAHNFALGALTAAVLRRALGGPPRLGALRDVSAFLATVAAAAPLAAAGLIAALVAAGVAPSFLTPWRLLSLSSVLTCLTFVPALLLSITRGRAWLAAAVGPPVIEAALLAAGVLAAGAAVYGTQAPGPATIPALVYAPLPLLLWAAIRFGPGGLSLATTAITVLALWQAAAGRGPFTTAAVPENIFNLQVYFLAFAGPLMLLAALVDQRRRAESALVQINAELAARVAERTGELALANRRLAAAREPAPLAADEHERRLADELHDSVSQTLYAANRAAEAIPAIWELDPEEGRERLVDLRRFTGGALAELRALLVELRPRALVDAPLHTTLGLLAEALEARGGPAVRAELRPVPLLPPDVQVMLYRVAQEALSNVSRHADATAVRLRLSASAPPDPGLPWSGSVALSVEDDGGGFLPEQVGQGRFGLASIRERAAACGAELAVVSRPGAGTLVSVVWSGEAAPEQPGRPRLATTARE